MDQFIPDTIEVHVLCIAKQSAEMEEVERQINQFKELALPIPEDLTKKYEEKAEREWRPSTIITRNIEGFYPDVNGSYTVFHMLSGSNLTVKQNYEEVKALMQGGFYAIS